MDPISTPTLPWLIAFLVVVPAAATAADFAQWNAESGELHLAPLQQGAHYQYDVSVRSTLSGFEATAFDLIDVRIGNVTTPDDDDEHEPPQRSHTHAETPAAAGEIPDDAYIPIDVERGTALWDVMTRPILDASADARIVETGTEHHVDIRLRDGMPVLDASDHWEKHWYTTDGRTTFHMLGNDREAHDGTTGGIATGLSKFHGQSWTLPGRAALPWDAWLAGEAPQEVRRGIVDGTPAVGIAEREVAPAGNELVLGCSAHLPEISYHEDPSTMDRFMPHVEERLEKYEQHERSAALLDGATSVAGPRDDAGSEDADPLDVPVALFEVTTTTTWFTEDSAFPLMTRCVVELRQEGPDGEVIGAITLEAKRDIVHAGHGAATVQWADQPATKKTSSVGKRASLVPGVPDDPDSLFRWSLQDAWAFMLEDEQMADFVNQGSGQLVLLDAFYAPTLPVRECAAAAVEDAGCPAPTDPRSHGQIRDEAKLSQSSWRLLITNEAGKVSLVHVTATFQDERRIDSELTYRSMAGTNGPSTVPAKDALVNDFAPPSQVLTSWLGRHHKDLDDWASREGSSFHIHFDQEAYEDTGFLPATYMPVYGPGSESPLVPEPEAPPLFEERSREWSDSSSTSSDTPPPQYPGPHETCQIAVPEEDPVATPGLKEHLEGVLSARSPLASSPDRRGYDGPPEEGMVCWEFVSSFDATNGRLLVEGWDYYESCEDDGWDDDQEFTVAAMSEVVEEPTRPLLAIGAAALVTTGLLAGLLRRAGEADVSRWLLLPLYAKLSKDKLLKHAARDEILQFVEQNPGVLTEEVRKQLDVGWGTVVYHLSALEHHGHLVSRKQGRHRSWFRPGAAGAEAKPALSVLRSQAARRLFDAVEGVPGLTQREAAEHLGVTHGAIIFQANRLQKVGLLRKERDGRNVRYFPGPQAAVTHNDVDEPPATPES